MAAVIFFGIHIEFKKYSKIVEAECRALPESFYLGTDYANGFQLTIKIERSVS
jgi:hypothetical protein